MLVKGVHYLRSEATDRAWQANQPAYLQGYIEAEGSTESGYD
jgi:hypothetical protein